MSELLIEVKVIYWIILALGVFIVVILWDIKGQLAEHNRREARRESQQLSESSRYPRAGSAAAKS